jgi:hypothetical protein
MDGLTCTHGVSQETSLLEVEPGDAYTLMLAKEDATESASRLRSIIDRAVPLLLALCVPELLYPSIGMLAARGVVPDI